VTWTATLYAPVYMAFGVVADITLSGGSTVYEIVALDKTAGIEVQLQGVDTTSVQPAVVCRMADLIDLGLAAADLRNAEIVINGGAWQVISYYPKPSPLGESDGELYLILTQADA